jgi:hypothetical protein
MEIAFDTLSYAKKLTDAGENREVAEAHAIALGEVIAVAATRGDTSGLRDEIILLRGDTESMETGIREDMKAMETGIREDMKAMETGIREDMKAMETGIREDMKAMETGIREDMKAMETGLRKDMAAMENGIQKDITFMRDEFDGKLEKQTLKLTVRLGGLIIVSTGLLATLMKIL